jgi:hypothetical protein
MFEVASRLVDDLPERHVDLHEVRCQASPLVLG